MELMRSLKQPAQMPPRTEVPLLLLKKAKEKRDWGKTLLDIAKAVALIGVVVAAFAYMDQDKLKDGMIKVGIILGSMFALLVVGSLVKGDISKTGTGMFKMAEAVGLIIAAVVSVMALLNATTDKEKLDNSWYNCPWNLRTSHVFL